MPTGRSAVAHQFAVRKRPFQKAYRQQTFDRPGVHDGRRGVTSTGCWLIDRKPSGGGAAAAVMTAVAPRNFVGLACHPIPKAHSLTRSIDMPKGTGSTR